MKLQEIFEEQEKSLVGLTIDGNKVAGSMWHGDFYCHFNELTSLEGSPAVIVGDFFCYSNKLKSLKNIHKIITRIDGILYCNNNPIKSHILGVLKIKNLQMIEIDNKKVQDIVNKYLPAGDILECQQELIEAGFEEYAQL